MFFRGVMYAFVKGALTNRSRELDLAKVVNDAISDTQTDQDTEIRMTKIEIYTTRTCPYCLRAKALLQEKGVGYKEIDVNSAPNLRQDMMKRANGGYTVPQIFINDEHIGGCDEMYALERAGKLDPKLAS